MTFAIIGHRGETGMLGAAVTSSSPAVAAPCAHARAGGVGAVATQNVIDPRLGPRWRTHGTRRDGGRGG